MPTATATVGPVPMESARAWLRAADDTVATLRTRPDLGVPAVVIEAFGRYLDTWRPLTASTEPTFVWTGVVDVDEVRLISVHWAQVTRLAREDPEGSGLHPARPEAEPFFNNLAAAMIDVIAAADAHADGFVDKFTAVVPAFNDQTPAPTPAPAAARVLLVDDSEDIRLLLRLGLRRRRSVVVCGEATNGEEALLRAAQLRPDVTLLDVHMPVMHGLTALPLLREAHPQMRIVLFTADDSVEVRRQASERGADVVLAKSASLDEIEAVLVRS